MNKVNSERILKLENQVRELKYDIAVLRSILSVKSPPRWSASALKNAYNCGLMPSPYGESIDLYRIVTLMNELNLLTKKVD